MERNWTKIVTRFGIFNTTYKKVENQECVLLWTDNIQEHKRPLLRLHSSCLFSESFSALDCDCSLQLDESLSLLSREGGVLVYLYQEGRGQGLDRKIKAMEIQREQGLDTHDAFQKLGYELDPRTYNFGIEALLELGISKNVRLISNNPRKQRQLEDAGFNVIERVSLSLEITPMIKDYLLIKRDKLGHDINLD